MIEGEINIAQVACRLNNDHLSFTSMRIFRFEKLPCRKVDSGKNMVQQKLCGAFQKCYHRLRFEGNGSEKRCNPRDDDIMEWLASVHSEGLKTMLRPGPFRSSRYQENLHRYTHDFLHFGRQDCQLGLLLSHMDCERRQREMTRFFKIFRHLLEASFFSWQGSNSFLVSAFARNSSVSNSYLLVQGGGVFQGDRKGATQSPDVLFLSLYLSRRNNVTQRYPDTGPLRSGRWRNTFRPRPCTLLTFPCYL